MGVRPMIRVSRFALLLLAVGCHQPDTRRSEPSVPLAPTTKAIVARGVAPTVPSASEAPAVPPPLPVPKAADALISPDDLQSERAGGGTLRVTAGVTKSHPTVLIDGQEPPLAPPTNLPAITEPPGSLPARPVGGVQPKPVPPGEFLPPIPALPDASPAPAKPKAVAPPPTSAPPPFPLPPPSVLPPLPASPPTAGLIDINGRPVTFDALSKLVDGNVCASCGGGMGAGGCSTCGDAPCRAGGKRCEPYPAHTAAGRVIGLIYSSVCCTDPCYQPRWEPLADASFFADAVRPKSSTRFRWDYGSHYSYPDRGEYLFARDDGKGRGPKVFGALKGIPFVDYHDLMLITEVGMGAAGVQIAVPYRSVNSTPYGADGAGFSDLTITAKTMLLDSELALFGFQMKTYIPVGQTGKGLGTGHVSLEPGLNFGLRCSPETYAQASVVEWIPLGGDKDYQGAHLRWAVSLNHILWRPIRDVQLIGTLESTGISFQDGLFTDPALGPTHLAKRTAAAIGPGFRMFFCDTFDFGLGWQHGITGKYLMRDQVRFEARYRY